MILLLFGVLVLVRYLFDVASDDDMLSWVGICIWFAFCSQVFTLGIWSYVGIGCGCSVAPCPWCHSIRVWVNPLKP